MREGRNEGTPVYEGGTSIDALEGYSRAQIAVIRPNTVLDLGAGAGKYGEICREILGSSVQIVAVEGCRNTVDNVLARKDGLYDEVECKLVQDFVFENSRKFDLAIFGDVLEHLPRSLAFKVVARAAEFTSNIIVNVPLYEIQQQGVAENPLEEHQSFFTFACFPGRFVIRECHVIAVKGSYYKMNVWIAGNKRKTLKDNIKKWLLVNFGLRGKCVIEMLGFDSRVDSQRM